MTTVHCIGVIACLICILIGGKGIVVSAFLFVVTLIVGGIVDNMDIDFNNNKIRKQKQEQELKKYEEYGIIECDSILCDKYDDLF